MEQPARVKFREDTDEICGYVFQIAKPPPGELTFDIGVAPQYVPILRMGTGYAKNAVSPIRVLGPGDDLVAVVMPVRIK